MAPFRQPFAEAGVAAASAAMARNAARVFMIGSGEGVAGFNGWRAAGFPGSCPGRGAALFVPLRRAGTHLPDKQAGPRLCSAPLRKGYALRCVRGTDTSKLVQPLAALGHRIEERRRLAVEKLHIGRKP